MAEVITVAVELTTEQITAIQIQMAASDSVETLPEFVSRMTLKLVKTWADQQREFFYTFNQQKIAEGIRKLADDPQRIDKLASIGITVVNPSSLPPLPPTPVPPTDQPQP
jgi:hypothetical protein